MDLNEIAQALIAGSSKKVTELTNMAVSENILPKEILEKGLIPGMNVIGERFKNNECFVPEVLISARAMHAGMDIIKPLLAQRGDKFIGKVVLGTVTGDMHDIGKNLVGMMLEGAGFEIIDLGVDVSPEIFVQVVRDQHPQIIAMSALLTTTLAPMKATIQALTDSGLRNNVKVIIGGAPVTQRYADQIGADGYAPDAASSVDIARNMVIN